MTVREKIYIFRFTLKEWLVCFELHIRKSKLIKGLVLENTTTTFTCEGRNQKVAEYLGMHTQGTKIYNIN